MKKIILIALFPILPAMSEALLPFDDTHPDDWSEGLRRYVKNGKVGFQDKSGRAVIPARWASADAFNYGYAVVYEGNWKREYLDQFREHWKIVPADAAATSYLIDREGRRAAPINRQSGKDYRHHEQYYPSPFRYDAREQAVADYLNDLAVLRELLHTTHYGNRTIRFEIAEREDGRLIFQPYIGQIREDQYALIVEKDGRLFVRELWTETLQPFKDWLRQELESTARWFAAHPDSNKKFDTAARLRETDSLCAQLGWSENDGIRCLK